MTVATLIRELADTGVRLSRRGDRLRVEGPAGALTAELKKRLTDHKGELLAALDAADPTEPIASRLRRLAKEAGYDPAIVVLIPVDELPEYVGLDDDQLSGLLAMKRDDSFRFAGKPAPGDTAAVLCNGCGPVLIDPAVAKVLPVVGGWPRALGCPWCFVRAKGIAIPRPQVTCADCAHRVPNTVNAGEGIGCCRVRADTWRHPHQRHHCGRWTAIQSREV